MFKDTDVTTGYDLLMTAENEEDLAELSRLLYVAATRAADYLILSAGIEEPGKAAGPVDGTDRQTLRSDDGRRTVAYRCPAEAAAQRPPSQLLHVTVNHRSEPKIQSKPVDLRQRRDLMKIVEKARQMAADGAGPAAAIPGAGRPRRRRPAAVFLLATDWQASRPHRRRRLRSAGRRRFAGAAVGRPRPWARWSTPCWRRSILPGRATLRIWCGVMADEQSGRSAGGQVAMRRQNGRPVPGLAASRPRLPRLRKCTANWSSCWPGRPTAIKPPVVVPISRRSLSARVHRLSVPRRRRRVAVGRL